MKNEKLVFITNYEEKDYSVENSLKQEDTDMLEEFKNYDGSTYICDGIGEIADNNVPVYNGELCEECWNLYSSGAYEEASQQGLMGEGNDLIQNLKCAWYEYNTQQLYNNESEMVYNYAMNYIVNNEKYLTEEEMEELENELESIDNNNSFSDITDLVDNIIDNREEDEEEIEE